MVSSRVFLANIKDDYEKFDLAYFKIQYYQCEELTPKGLDEISKIIIFLTKLFRFLAADFEKREINLALFKNIFEIITEGNSIRHPILISKFHEHNYRYNYVKYLRDVKYSNCNIYFPPYFTPDENSFGGFVISKYLDTNPKHDVNLEIKNIIAKLLDHYFKFRLDLVVSISKEMNDDLLGFKSLFNFLVQRGCLAHKHDPTPISYIRFLTEALKLSKICGDDAQYIFNRVIEVRNGLVNDIFYRYKANKEDKKLGRGIIEEIQDQNVDFAKEIIDKEMKNLRKQISKGKDTPKFSSEKAHELLSSIFKGLLDMGQTNGI